MSYPLKLTELLRLWFNCPISPILLRLGQVPSWEFVWMYDTCMDVVYSFRPLLKIVFSVLEYTTH